MPILLCKLKEVKNLVVVRTTGGSYSSLPMQATGWTWEEKVAPTKYRYRPACQPNEEIE
ncbi:MAG: hypothetical protein AB1397_02610 [bacterium]